MKYKYFTWIQDVLQELLCLSSIQEKRAESTGKGEWYNEMRCGDCYSKSAERRVQGSSRNNNGETRWTSIMLKRGPSCRGNCEDGGSDVHLNFHSVLLVLF
ncbi:hypothetical protein NC651_039638 [Populus alba x Populus x berolinensis]|nr:hypothetical protein NC651_039638 [Populus alba x Populus x berolinensis]